MLKRSITYEDFNGVEQTDVCYFNISKPEIVDLETKYEGGLKGMLERVIEAKDFRTILKEFKEIILLSYGVKSEDGKRFIKTQEMRDAFEQSEAYNVLFMELINDDDVAAEFLKGALPKDLSEGITQQQLKVPDQPTGPPSPPTSTPSL